MSEAGRHITETRKTFMRATGCVPSTTHALPRQEGAAISEVKKCIRLVIEKADSVFRGTW